MNKRHPLWTSSGEASPLKIPGWAETPKQRLRFLCLNLAINSSEDGTLSTLAKSMAVPYSTLICALDVGHMSNRLAQRAESVAKSCGLDIEFTWLIAPDRIEVDDAGMIK